MRPRIAHSRSYLPLLRSGLPGEGPSDSAGAAENPAIPNLKDDEVFIEKAALPGQNSVEVYGTALFTLAFFILWCAEITGSWWLGPPLGLLLIHAFGLCSAMTGHWLRERYRHASQPSVQASIWPQRVFWGLLTAMAWIALLVPLPISRWLALSFLLLLAANLLCWYWQNAWIGLGLVTLIHAFVLLGAPFFGPWFVLALLAPCHAAMLYASLSPHSTLFGPRVRTLPISSRKIWLTIDDGPCDDTAAFLDVLDAHEAKATFFVVGKRARDRPEDIRAIQARGHGIGNHSFTHPEKGFWACLWRPLQRQIERAQETLEEITGERPRLFRPPVGFSNPLLQPLLAKGDLINVGWSARGFDAVDADIGRSLRRLQSQIRPGAIVLLHQGRPASLALLRQLLTWLDEQGIRCECPNLVENGELRLS